jgi:cytochrome c oxidase assembly factor CtaG
VERAGHLILHARQTVLFLLGIAVVIDAIASPVSQIGQLTAGLVMLGLVPVESVVAWLTRDHRGPPTLEGRNRR